MTSEILGIHKNMWDKKPILRSVYLDYYKRIVNQCNNGNALEVGGGSGNFKDFYSKKVISTDIVYSPWIDLAADAQFLPFKSDYFSNIVGIDVLHHIEFPNKFLSEAERVLKPGGRIILLEPAITWLSWFFYKFFHSEPLDLNSDPFLVAQKKDSKRNPFDANQAIPTILFVKNLELMENFFPSLKIVKIEHLSFVVYPLSGGFRKWSLIPEFMINLILKLERLVPPVIAKFIGFRLLIVLEKNN